MLEIRSIKGITSYTPKHKETGVKAKEFETRVYAEEHTFREVISTSYGYYKGVPLVITISVKEKYMIGNWELESYLDLAKGISREVQGNS